MDPDCISLSLWLTCALKFEHSSARLSTQIGGLHLHSASRKKPVSCPVLLPLSYQTLILSPAISSTLLSQILPTNCLNSADCCLFHNSEADKSYPPERITTQPQALVRSLSYLSRTSSLLLPRPASRTSTPAKRRHVRLTRIRAPRSYRRRN